MAVKVAVTKNLVAVKGPKVAVVFGYSGSEGFCGCGNPGTVLQYEPLLIGPARGEEVFSHQRFFYLCVD